MLATSYLSKNYFTLKPIILAYIGLVTGILLAEIPELIELLNEYDYGYLNERQYTIPAFFALILLSIKGIYEISRYTDETIPLKLGLLSFVLAVLGLVIFFRLLVLGSVMLVVASHWNRSIVRTYYPRNRIV